MSSLAITNRMDRRDAIKWVLAAAATMPLMDRAAFAASTPAAQGYGTDPDLLKLYKAGDAWPLTFTEAQRATAAALCDVILPADTKSPSASSLRVQDFIDEWISAPYAAHANDRRVIIDGLAWLEAESLKRFGSGFPSLVMKQKAAICDDVCLVAKAKPELQAAARFFARFRDLAAGGYYSTPEGAKDLGYIGNVPLATFDGPPPEVLKKLGLA